jgi:heavy metal response regulator
MRILIVEDDTNVARFIEKGLKEQGYDVDVAYDGEEGLSLATAVPYDLIILDILLPKIDGMTVCRKLRAKNRTPILLLTVRDLVEDKVAGLEAGADDYLTKPFAFVELLARIRVLLRRATGPLAHRLKVADLELDPETRHAWRGGKVIPLTHKEYALLEYLVRNKNRVLTRTAIIDYVWGINFDTMTNIVDVQIRALRAKIDRDFSSPLITTVRGAGYMLEAPEF